MRDLLVRRAEVLGVLDLGLGRLRCLGLLDGPVLLLARQLSDLGALLDGDLAGLHCLLDLGRGLVGDRPAHRQRAPADAQILGHLVHRGG